MLCGMMYMAIPIGIIGAAFSHVWEERSRLLLMQRMRTCVERVGYTPSDLMAMFKVLDQNRDGSLDFEEFSAMLEVMQIEVEEKFVMEVFESFDADCEGSIDFRELLRGLFPHTHRIYIDHSTTERTSDRETHNQSHNQSTESSFLLIAKSSKGTTETKLRASAEMIQAASRSLDTQRTLSSTLSPLPPSRTMSPGVIAGSIVHYPKARISSHGSKDNVLADYPPNAPTTNARISIDPGVKTSSEHSLLSAEDLNFATDHSTCLVDHSTFPVTSKCQQTEVKRKELLSLGTVRI